MKSEKVKGCLSNQAAFLIKVVYKTDINAKRMQRVTSFKVYLTNPSLRCALFSPLSFLDDNIGNMVETAIFAQWIQRDKTDVYYANWSKGRDKGEVDLIGLDIHIVGALRACRVAKASHILHLGRKHQVLEQVRLVHEQLVHAKLLEVQQVIHGFLAQLGDAVLQPLLHGSQLLHRPLELLS